MNQPDTTALVRPVSRREARSLRDQLAREDASDWGNIRVGMNLLLAGLVGGGLMLAILIVLVIVGVLTDDPVVIPIGIGAMGFSLVIMVLVYVLLDQDRRVSRWRVNVRLIEFARANGQQFSPLTEGSAIRV